MARVIGPLYSIEASGTIAKSMVYANWKGRQYCREYVIPQNPGAAKQVNVRTAFTLLVDEWQGLSGGDKTTWNTFAEPFQMSGFDQFMKRGMLAYVDQLGTSTTPASVGVSGTPPTEVWTWA